MSVSYRVEIEAPAWDAMMRLGKRDQERVLVAIEALEVAPRPSGVKKLAGVENLYRVRVGDFRIIYTVNDGVLLVVIVGVGNRREVYKSR